MAADATPTQARAYVMKAAASDLYEIQSSRLALQKASSAALRPFAQMLIEHHTMTTQQVAAAARAAGMTPPPPALEPHQRRMIAELERASGSSFDAVFLRQQRTAHQMALGLHSNYADEGDTPQLRQAATGAVPVIRQHIAQLENMPGS